MLALQRCVVILVNICGPDKENNFRRQNLSLFSEFGGMLTLQGQSWAIWEGAYLVYTWGYLGQLFLNVR